MYLKQSFTEHSHLSNRKNKKRYIYIYKSYIIKSGKRGSRNNEEKKKTDLERELFSFLPPFFFVLYDVKQDPTLFSAHQEKEEKDKKKKNEVAQGLPNSNHKKKKENEL